MTIARRIRVSGLVQGVGFRWSTVRQARAAGVAGWVRNLEDGSVEAFVQGAEEAVDTLVGWMRRGPPGARVDALESAEATPSPDLAGFAARR